jgi:hypothetical protein
MQKEVLKEAAEAFSRVVQLNQVTSSLTLLDLVASSAFLQ